MSRSSYLLASVALLIPCFWHSRIQAGDLGSHLYNAWLVQLIGRGQAPGLRIAPQSTNVLFDWMLSGLFRAGGAEAAERIAVSAAVLVFFWGSFAFLKTVSGRAWPFAPVLAMLAYGWVFHMGFFNFYLSLGLCFWFLALAWKGSWRRVLVAAPLILLAYLAHALPVVWALGILGYAWMWGRAGARRRTQMLVAGIAGIVLVRSAIAAFLETRWYTYQIWHVTGANQALVFADKYKLVAFGVAALWLWLAIDRRRGTLGPSPLLSLSILMAVGIFAIPNAVFLPAYTHQLAFISERMSLPLAVLICALLAGAPLRKWQTGAAAALAVVFFGFLYSDETVLNRFEDDLDAIVARVPAGSRVVMSVIDPHIEVNALTHMIDRACIGRCWSYANYEPSSGQFRVRIAGPTQIVARTDRDTGLLDIGLYQPPPGDPPLVQIIAGQQGRLGARVPAAGAPIGTTQWNGL